MPRRVRPWFRFYTEAVADRKIRRLSPAQRWLWVAILSAARESPVPGRLFIADGVPMTGRELADYADVPPRSIRPAIDLMCALGMLHIDIDGVVVVTNWEQRQYESDVSTGRVRAHRSRTENPVIPGLEAPVETFQQRSNPVPTTVPTTVSETDQRTETDTETEVGVKEEGNRYVTLPPRDATTPPPEGTCSLHPNGDPGVACVGCARAREWRETRERAERQAAVDTRRACPRCDENGMLLDPTTRTPTGRCDHTTLEVPA